MSRYLIWIDETGLELDMQIEIKSPSLEAMQEHVEGYIEHVSVLFNGQRASMMVNEEARLTGKYPEPSLFATEVYHANGRMRGFQDVELNSIYGPAVLLVGFEKELGYG